LKIKEKYYESVGEQVYFTRLSNGLTIHLIPKEDYYETYGIITTKFGSVDTRILVNGDERQYPAGIAHFLEHKVFEDENGQDYLKKFVHLGSESNAFTSFTKTSYLFSTTSKVPEINCYWRWFQRFPLQKNLYLRKEKSFNKKLECTKIVQTIDYFLVL